MELPRGSTPVSIGQDGLTAQAARGATLDELRPRFEGSEHAFLLWVDEQLRSGDWQVAASQSDEGGSGGGASGESPVELYGKLLARIHEALRVAGEEPRWLQSFLDSPPPGMADAFAEVTLSPEGRLDLERITANVGGDGDPRSRARLFEVLDSLAAYALFSAKNRLPPEISEALAEELARMRGEG